MNLPNPLDVVPNALVRGATRRAYRAQQAAIRLPVIASQQLLRAVASERREPPAEAVAALRREYEQLQRRDLENVERGAYPASLLFQLPWWRYARRLPGFLVDLPRVMARSKRGDFKQVPDLEGRRFPAYFRRTFHWQTDGYLSAHSASIYDLSVEFLFMGCADVMRRMVIPPITRAVRRSRSRPSRILDVGCGTGRTLAQLAVAIPGQQLFGVDLSPFYLAEARELLADVPETSLVVENAEKLPYRDGYFDVVTSTYLLHELPRRARRKVVAEMVRVLAPGGRLVLEDSAQHSEAHDLAVFLESFASEMHETYYRDYVNDDIAGLLSGAGLEVESVERAWLAKVVSARKPADVVSVPVTRLDG
jgi:ubiquinone/menaquinone biosynthesis C-methylase UbiE